MSLRIEGDPLTAIGTNERRNGHHHRDRQCRVSRWSLLGCEIQEAHLPQPGKWMYSRFSRGFGDAFSIQGGCRRCFMTPDKHTNAYKYDSISVIWDTSLGRSASSKELRNSASTKDQLGTRTEIRLKRKSRETGKIARPPPALFFFNSASAVPARPQSSSLRRFPRQPGETWVTCARIISRGEEQVAILWAQLRFQDPFVPFGQSTQPRLEGGKRIGNSTNPEVGWRRQRERKV